MKQVQIIAFGDPDVLRVVDTDVPKPGKGEVLVRVAGAGINPIDFKTRRGLGFAAERIRGNLPWSPGYEFSGWVEAVGESVGRWRIGDAVFGMTPFPDRGGAYSEFAVTRKELLVPAPGSIPVANAGAVPLAALTAWQALFEIGSLQAESKILIHAAAGGVGHFAVQMAKTLDAYVIATASPDNHDFLLELGADEVIDYHSTAFETVCYGLDFVLDNVGGDVGLRSLDVLSSHGQMVTVPTISAQDIIAQGEERGIEVTGLTVHFDAQQLEEIADLIDTEDVKPHISTVFTLAQVQQAHTLAETGRGRGKLLLLP